MMLTISMDLEKVEASPDVLSLKTAAAMGDILPDGIWCNRDSAVQSHHP